MQWACFGYVIRSVRDDRARLKGWHARDDEAGHWSEVITGYLENFERQLNYTAPTAV